MLGLVGQDCRVQAAGICVVRPQPANLVRARTRSSMQPLAVLRRKPAGVMWTWWRWRVLCVTRPQLFGRLSPTRFLEQLLTNPLIKIDPDPTRSKSPRCHRTDLESCPVKRTLSRLESVMGVGLFLQAGCWRQRSRKWPHESRCKVPLRPSCTLDFRQQAQRRSHLPPTRRYTKGSLQIESLAAHNEPSWGQSTPITWDGR